MILFKKSAILLLVFAWLFPVVANAALYLNVEEPVGGGVWSGVSNVRGWVVTDDAIDRVELWVDGTYWADIPYGGRRPDVGAAFPGFGGSNDSGFSMAYNYNELSRGQHTFLILVYDSQGASASQSVTFYTERFPNPYMPDINDVDVSTATCTPFTDTLGASLGIDYLRAEGERFHVWLLWKPQTQRFEIEYILPQP